MSTPTTLTELLKTHGHELVKQYTTYDGSNRPQYVYTAVIGAITGSPCIKTTYQYSGTSSRITKRAESYDVWDATYD